MDKCHYLPRQSLAGEWTSVSTSPAKFGGGGIVNLLNFGDEDEDDDDDEKRLLGLRQAGSRRQKGDSPSRTNVTGKQLMLAHGFPTAVYVSM